MYIKIELSYQNLEPVEYKFQTIHVYSSRIKYICMYKLQNMTTLPIYDESWTSNINFILKILAQCNFWCKSRNIIKTKLWWKKIQNYYIIKQIMIGLN